MVSIKKDENLQMSRDYGVPVVVCGSSIKGYKFGIGKILARARDGGGVFQCRIDKITPASSTKSRPTLVFTDR